MISLNPHWAISSKNKSIKESKSKNRPYYPPLPATKASLKGDPAIYWNKDNLSLDLNLILLRKYFTKVLGKGLYIELFSNSINSLWRHHCSRCHFRRLESAGSNDLRWTARFRRLVASGHQWIDTYHFWWQIYLKSKMVIEVSDCLLRV